MFIHSILNIKYLDSLQKVRQIIIIALTELILKIIILKLPRKFLIKQHS